MAQSSNPPVPNSEFVLSVWLLFGRLFTMFFFILLEVLICRTWPVKVFHFKFCDCFWPLLQEIVQGNPVHVFQGFVVKVRLSISYMSAVLQVHLYFKSAQNIEPLLEHFRRLTQSISGQCSKLWICPMLSLSGPQSVPSRRIIFCFCMLFQVHQRPWRRFRSGDVNLVLL